jgi:hypothetical protein
MAPPVQVKAHLRTPLFPPSTARAAVSDSCHRLLRARRAGGRHDASGSGCDPGGHPGPFPAECQDIQEPAHAVGGRPPALRRRRPGPGGRSYRPGPRRPRAVEGAVAASAQVPPTLGSRAAALRATAPGPLRLRLRGTVRLGPRAGDDRWVAVLSVRQAGRPRGCTVVAVVVVVRTARHE